jgi:hypothetical protein
MQSLHLLPVAFYIHGDMQAWILCLWIVPEADAAIKANKMLGHHSCMIFESQKSQRKATLLFHPLLIEREMPWNQAVQ